MIVDLLPLGDDRAHDPVVAGAKAAALAVCGAHGLPVPDGFVVPLAWGIASVQAGIDALPHRGSGGARLSASAQPLDPSREAQLVNAAAELGYPLMVRSSAIVESSKVWSGAFASFADIRPAETPTALKSCWSSVFGLDALGRLEAEGLELDQIGMAALVQREIHAKYGGVAQVDANGIVTITWVAGSPALIVSGHEPGNTLTGADDDLSTAADPDLRQVSKLVRQLHDLTGFNHMEWAQDADQVWLLQASHVESAAVAEFQPLVCEDTDPRFAALARLIARFPGQAMEEWVLSWAIGLGELPAPASVAPAAASTLYDQIEQTASELRTQRWNVPGSKALDIAKQTLLELRSQDPIPALDVMCNLDLVNQGLAARLLGLIDTLAQVLAAEGRIPTAAVLWHLPAQTIADIAHLRVPKLAPSHRFGMGSWEPMLFELICAAGTPYRAVAVVAGRGAGLLRPIQRLQDMESFKPREIVAALNPLNNLSPLLWSAPGVVTLHGGRGAHVFEVAGALSVPSLCNVGVDPKTLCEGALAAVDGTNATLWLLA